MIELKVYTKEEIQKLYNKCVKEPNGLIETIEDAMDLWCKLFDKYMR